MRRRLLLALLLLLVAPAPADAHESDPQVQTVLEAVRPALPAPVVVQVVAGVAAQVVVDNPTDRVLEVLGEADRPFLRVSAAGVQADLASPDFARTSNPVGAVPRAAPGPPRWALVSRGSAWGWYDHRLHPAALPAPADRDRPARLGTWTVPLRYGGAPHVLTGSVRFVPLRGAVEVTVDPAPPGVQAQVLQGRLPGLFLALQGEHTVEVRGVDGEPFLRLAPTGSTVDVRSRTHVEDRQARGEPVGAPGPSPSPSPLAGPSHSWLDARLRYPEAAPPERVQRSSVPVELRRWSVPLVVDGRRTALTGSVRWVPRQVRAQRTSSSAGDRPLVVPVVAVGAALLLVAVVVLRRRRAAA